MHLRVFCFPVAILLSSRVSSVRVKSQASQVKLQTRRFEQDLLKNLTISGRRGADTGAATIGTTQWDDSRKDDFTMPQFAKLALVRPAELEQIWRDDFDREKKTENPQQIVGMWGDGKGIGQKMWNDEKLSIRIPNFNKWCKPLSPDVMTLHDFAQMKQTTFASAYAPPIKDGLNTQLGDDKDAQRIKEWLQSKYDYSKDVALQLAEDFLDMDDALREVQTLATFATLDRAFRFRGFFDKKDGLLKYIEAHEALSETESPVDTRIEWEDVARVESADFAGLGFPSSLTNDILGTMTAKSEEKDKGKIAFQDWKDYKLSEVLTQFVKRDKIKEDDKTKEKFSGNLKFFQMADVLPDECDASGKIDLKLGKQPNEQGAPLEATVFAPTLDQLAAKVGIMSASPENFLRWLLEKGYTDGWLASSKYATNMANQVVKWGSGMIAIPGVERPGPKDMVLQGPKGANQYSDTACKLAAFVNFDDRRHGKLKFDKVLPILHQFCANFPAKCKLPAEVE